MTRLLFCQNDSPMGGSFWQKDSLITHTLFELWLIIMFSTVVNFAQQPPPTNVPPSPPNCETFLTSELSLNQTYSLFLYLIQVLLSFLSKIFCWTLWRTWQSIPKASTKSNWVDWCRELSIHFGNLVQAYVENQDTH